ncbi:hypothetical protein COU80_05530 [Candidatus Peregrinibacteria bacterium CG10_big_fil_rev_8_21_14_0_10_55_24]|nr:MAG: hypothetical protein COU80_05530 [Candidatus Peregrinibacteria bacterium CG10_big_fil_rev_8_21_14_0_10_55_24]
MYTLSGMPVTPYQILAPLVALLAISYAWNLVFRQKKTIWEALLWSVFWGFIAAIALFPDLMSYLTTVTGIKNRENAVFITFFGMLFFVVFYLVMRVEDLEQRQTRIVRKVALRDSDLNGENDPHS